MIRSAAKLVPYIFLVATLVAAGYFIYSYRNDLWPLLSTMKIGLGVVAVMLAGVGTCLGFVIWRVVLTDLGAEISWRQAANVFFVSQIGKYIPGSVWPVLAQMELGRRTNTPRRTMVAANLLSIAMSLVVGLLLAAASLPWSGAEALRSFWWVFLALPFLLPALHPRVLSTLLDWVLTRLHREPLKQHLTWSAIARISVVSSLSWLFQGTSLFLLTAALGQSGWPVMIAATGGMALGFSAGLLFVIAPAGAGVRDAVLIASLGTVVSSPTAIAAGLLCRLAFILVDFSLAAGFWFARPRHVPSAGPSSLNPKP